MKIYRIVLYHAGATTTYDIDIQADAVEFLTNGSVIFYAEYKAFIVAYNATEWVSVTRV